MADHYLAEHAEYLADSVRNAAYRRAIDATVRSGHRVLDLGSGTGLLGILAARRGARVFAVDESPLIELARRNYRQNGFGEQVSFFHCHSTAAQLPAQVDVVIADQMGPSGLEAGLLECFQDAAQRLLAPGGRLIPCRLAVNIAAVEHPRLRERAEFWTRQPAGVDLQPVADVAVHTPRACEIASHQLLSGETNLFAFELGKTPEKTFAATVELPILRAGLLDGIGGWFAADLTDAVSITNSPLATERIDRPQACWPLFPPVEVAPGDRLRTMLRVTPSQSLATWRVEVFSPGAAAPRADYKRSTFLGLLRTREELERTRRDSRPQLSVDGQCRLTVLALCDGTRALSEIEQELTARYPRRFPTSADAAEFVARIVMKDGR